MYRGELADGCVVAIKVLKPEAAAEIVAKGDEEWSGAGGFRKELEILSRYQHPNLVALLGFSFRDEQGGGGKASRWRSSC